jgi:peptidyl-prolyl cis-trans isomerase C
MLVGLGGCDKQRDPEPAAEGDAAAGSARSEQPGERAATGEIVAKVGDSVITLADFEAQLNQQNPLIRARYKSLEQKKKLLDNLVQREAMVLEAKRLGLDEDPEVIRNYKKILARHLVNQEFNKKRVKDIKISDADIQQYYEQNHERYHSPEKVRVHLIFIAGPRSQPDERAAARAEARRLLTKLEADPNDRRLFLELARKHSDDEKSAKIGGDTNFRTRAQLEERYGAKVAEAAFGLKKARDLSGVIETDGGFYILRQSGRQSAIDLPLEKVEGQIKTTLFARARGEAYKAFVEQIEKKVGVEIYDDVISKAEVDTSDSPAMRRPFPGAPRPSGRAGQKGRMPVRRPKPIDLPAGNKAPRPR